MHGVPTWLTLLFATFLLAFGAYRIWFGLQPTPTDPDAPPPPSLLGRGMARTSKRVHVAIGAIYVLFAAALIAMALGWAPLTRLIAPSTEEPTKDNAPVKPGTVPVDQPPGTSAGNAKS